MGKVAGGSAATMVGLSTSIYLGVHPTWGTEHPHLALAVYLATLLALMFLLLQFAWFRRGVGVRLSSEGHGGDAIPPAQNTSTATANENKVEQHFYGVSPPPSAQEPTPLAPASEPEYPELHLRFRYAKVSGTNNVWRERHPKEAGAFGYQSLLLDVSVELPRTSKRVREFTLYGAVKFVGTNRENIGFLNRLCWIGTSANEMDFEVEKSATLFVLCFEGNEEFPGNVWKAFQSKIDRVPDHPFVGEDWDPSRDFGRMTIPVDGSPMVTVSLVDAHTNHVVATKQVRLYVVDGEFKVQDGTLNAEDGSA